jgi:nitrate reductase / nitrite oxidoreductase, beta subunit
VQAQRDVIKDPFDPEIIAAAKANGIPDSKIAAAQQSPVYQFVKKWKLALPLHPEFRTLPMLFYVPPLGPVLAKTGDGVYDNVASEARLGPLMSSLERSRISLRYMASLLSGGNEEIIREVYRKLVAVRVYMRAKKVKDIPEEEVQRALTEGKTTAAEVEAIFRLTSLPTFEERFVVPPMERDTAVESLFPSLDPVSRNYPVRKGAVGAGFHTDPARGP